MQHCCTNDVPSVVEEARRRSKALAHEVLERGDVPSKYGHDVMRLGVPLRLYDELLGQGQRLLDRADESLPDVRAAARRARLGQPFARCRMGWRCAASSSSCFFFRRLFGCGGG